MADINKTLAQIVGVVLTLVGILGFLMGDTLVGFGVNALHNVVHLLTGVIALWVGFGKADMAANFNKWFGLVYILVAILGRFVPAVASLLNINMADNWLHLILGLVMAGVGFSGKSA